MSVCASVRLSVTSRSCTKMAKPRITLRKAYDSPGTLVLRRQKSWRNSNGITPTDAPNRGGVGSDRRFMRNISLYLRNVVAQRHILRGAHPGGYDSQIRTRPRFLYNAAIPQVSSSCVYSFGSYRVDKQTNKQTPLKTSNALRYATTLYTK